MKQSVYRWLLCACILFTLLQSGQCVSRLFVDEFTGYTNELVTASDVDTDLMIVDTQNVAGGVAATSDDSHTVDTPGSIGFSTSSSTISASQNIEIKSYGENVAFRGDEISLSANGDLVNNALHTSIVGDEVNLDGANLLINGEQTKLRTPGEIYFTSQADIRFNTEDKIQFFASEISVTSDNTVTINSELSNVHLEAGDQFYMEGSDFFISADSGVRILSEQDDLNIYSEATTNLFADNIQLDGISQSGVFSQNGTITANAVGINIDSDRTIAGASSIYMSADNPDADLSIISFGVVQSASNLVSLFSASIELSSSDQVKLTSEFNITFATIEDITHSADTINNNAFRDVHYQSNEGTTDLQFSGEVTYSSVDGDFNINAEQFINLTSFNTEINAIESHTITADQLDVEAGTYIDFVAEGDMNVTTSNNFQLGSDDSVEMFGRTSATLGTTSNINFVSSVNPFIVQSTENINFNTGEGSVYTATASTIEYTAYKGTDITTADDITFTATSSIDFDTNGALIFVASRDIDFNANYATINSLSSLIGTSTYYEDSYLISYSTADIGTFTVSTEGTAIGTTYDPANRANDIILAASGAIGTIVYQAEGDVEWGSERLITFDYDTAFNMDANDIAISVEDSLTSSSSSNTAFVAPTIYGLIKTGVVVPLGTLTFNGATSFTAPTSRDDSVSLTSTSITYSFVSAEIFGGMTHFIIDDDFSLNSGANIDFSTHNDKDITISNSRSIFTSSKNVNVAFGDDFIIDSSSFASNVPTYNLNSKKLIQYITSNFTMTGSTITIAGNPFVSHINFEASNGNAFTTTKTFQLNYKDSLSFDAATSNNFNSAGNLQFIYDGNNNIFGNTNINANAVQFNSTSDIHALYHQIALNLNTNMSISATTGFTIDATNNDRFISDNDIFLQSPQQIEANGGDIEISGTNLLDINNPLGPVTIGSNYKDITALNYSPVDVDVTTLTGSTQTYFSATAGGNLETTDVGIYVGDILTPPSITLSSSASHNVYGNNGINVHASSLINSVSNQFQYFVTENGYISATTFGTAPTLTFTTAGSGAVVGGSIMFQSTNAGISTNSFGDISYSATGGFFSDSSESGKIHTLYDSGNIDVSSTANNAFIIGGDYTVSNGDANYLNADLTVTAGRDLTINSTQSDFRIHSLSHDTLNNIAISFSANDSFTIPPPSPNSMSIFATNQINYYPAGDVTQNAGGNAVFTAGGAYTFGTDQGDSSFALNSVSYTSARDYNVTAGGVNGNVIGDFDVTSLTAASNFNVKSNYSTTVSVNNNLVFTAGRNAHFIDQDEESGIYGNSGYSTSYISRSTTRPTGLNVTGHAITLSSSTVTNTLTTQYTIGQNNAQFNPQINGQVTSWTVNSVGSNALTSNNHDVVINTNTFGFSTHNNTLIKAGGFLEFITTWDSLATGQGILRIDTDVGQVTATATNGYIDYFVRRNGAITSTNKTSFISTGLSSSSPISNGILFRGTKGKLSFTAGQTHNEDITTTATIDVGNGGFSATSTLAGVTLTASSSTGTGTIRSSGKIASTASDTTLLSTSSNNARMFISTTGRSSPLAFAATDAMVVSGSGDLTLVSDTTVSHFVKGVASIVTSVKNEGQMNLDASGELVFQGNNVTMITNRDFDLSATGQGSMFEISALGTFSAISTLDTYFSTEAGEGGSLRFSADYETGFSFSSTTASIDSDNDFNFITNGTLVFDGSSPMKASVTGFIDIASNKSITLRADYFNTITTSNHADIILHANDGDVTFGSVESTNFITGHQGYGNATFVIDGSSSFTVQGNFSGPITPLLVESAIGDSIYYAKESNIVADAYERLSFLAFGSTTDTGYVEFVARGTIDEGGDPYGIIVETTHTGGDIYMTGVGAVVTGFSVSFQALGTTSETGYISIINDYSLGKGSRGTTSSVANPLTEFEDYPAVKFDSGTETLVKSDTGDIRVNFGRRLFLRGGSVSALASGGISFDVRGQNRLIQSDSSYFSTNPAIRVRYFNVLSFRTENLGSGEIRVAAESSSIVAATGITLIRNNIDQLLIQGSAGVDLRVRSVTQFPGITFTAKDYYNLNAFDEDIVQYGRIIRFGVLNNNGILTVTSHANVDSQTSFSALGGTTVTAQITAQWNAAGDLDMRVEANTFISSTNTVVFQSADDLNVFYGETISFSAPTVRIRTTTSIYGGIGTYDVNAHGSRIIFNGLHNTNGYRQPIDGFEDPVPGRPKVTINPGQNQFYVTGQFNNVPTNGRPVTRGGACLYERALGFVKDQGVENICICLDKVWLCTEPYIYKNFNKNYNFPIQNYPFGSGPL